MRGITEWLTSQTPPVSGSNSSIAFGGVHVEKQGIQVTPGSGFRAFSVHQSSPVPSWERSATVAGPPRASRTRIANAGVMVL